jgi:hypothetical protein
MHSLLNFPCSKSGSLNLLEPSGPVKACKGIALLFAPINSLSNTAACNIFSPLLNWELAHKGALLCYVIFCHHSYKPKEGGNLYFCLMGQYVSSRSQLWQNTGLTWAIVHCFLKLASIVILTEQLVCPVYCFPWTQEDHSCLFLGRMPVILICGYLCRLGHMAKTPLM